MQSGSREQTISDGTSRQGNERGSTAGGWVMGALLSEVRANGAGKQFARVACRRFIASENICRASHRLDTPSCGHGPVRMRHLPSLNKTSLTQKLPNRSALEKTIALLVCFLARHDPRQLMAGRSFFADWLSTHTNSRGHSRFFCI